MTQFSKKLPPELINEMAQNIDMGLVNYFNPKEQKLIAIPKQSFIFDEKEFQEDWKEDLATIKTWKKDSIIIHSMDSVEMFKVMETFTSEISDRHLKYKLENSLEGQKPFKNFKNTLDHSNFRQDWYDFKMKYQEKYIREIIDEEMEFRKL